MKILTSTEMAAADAATFNRIAVSSRAVMESAGRSVGTLVCSMFAEELEQGVLVLAGAGNNGGDGLVVARMLLDLGCDVTVCSLKSLDELEGDVAENARSLLAVGGQFIELTAENWEQQVEADAACGIIIDALFGTGIKGAVRGLAADIIPAVNELSEEFGIPIVSIDIPSGVEADTGLVPGVAIEADVTLALQCLKIGNVLFPGAEHGGEVIVADIGVSQTLPEIMGISRELLTESSVSEVLQYHVGGDSQDHKGVRGHVAVIGGSMGHYGAPRMSAEAAIRAAAGLVTMYLPQSAAERMSTEVLELMCCALPDDGAGSFASVDAESVASVLSKKASLVFGPGIGQSAAAMELLTNVLTYSREHDVPLVLDADGINLLSAQDNKQQLLSPLVVMTPHVGEMARLLSCSHEDVLSDRLGVALRASTSLGCWIVLKGARTIIAGPEGEVFINPAAIPTLATAGTGDVLAGVIAAFLANGMTPGEAAGCGVFVHGGAGEVMYLDAEGPVGVTAGDIIQTLPVVINRLLEAGVGGISPFTHVLPGSLQGVAE